MEDQVSGSVDKIVFANEENGYTVAELRKRNRDQEAVCIVGNFPSIQIGETITCKGRWAHHPSFGRQFQVDKYELSAPKDILGIQRYLESGNIRGIGPVNAKKIVDTFGEATLDIIDTEPMRLTEIEGIGKKKVATIIEHWEEQKSMRDIMVFLRGHGIGSSLSQKIYRKYGDNSVAVVKENPYALASEMFGVGFKSADKIAHEVGIAKNSPMRIESGIEYVLQDLSDNGHTCYPEESFIEIAEKMLEVDRAEIYTSITTLEGKGKITREPLPTATEPLLHIWLKSLYISERGIAKHLYRLINGTCAIRPVKVDKAIEWAQGTNHISFAGEQQKAIEKSLVEKLHIITGGPGTGKSTITKAILSIHAKLSENILLAAPTGKAAKRMSEITRRRASTIHSLLEFDFTNGGFKRNQDNPLKCDLLIIDEASMIDTYLMHSLLRAIPTEARVIFIGDIDQLPSVGPGNVLKDMIDSRRIPLTRLFQIFRQAKGSKIVVNAHNINRGIFPELALPTEKSDFVFFEIESPEEIAAKILSLVKNEVPASFSFDPLLDIQVLSPMRKGVIGIENLNSLMQQALNPRGESIERFGRSFRKGDKVMQIRNNYSKNVFNGDVGKVLDIDTEDKKLYVLFDDKEVEYESADLDELTHAYAVSIHKYQGSECPCIIIPIHTTHYKLLQKNLLYTGITRGKKLVILLGTKKAILLAIKNDEVEMRHTGLSTLISDYIPATFTP